MGQIYRESTIIDALKTQNKYVRTRKLPRKLRRKKANQLERNMEAKEALLYVKSLANKHQISSSNGIANIIARLAIQGIEV